MMPLAERFDAKYIPEPMSGCWIWLGAHDSRGYGQIHVNGKTQRAARVSWSLANGVDFPAGMDSCHSCDNRICVNPSHIRPGTRLENMADAKSRNRIFRVPSELCGSWRRSLTHCSRGHEFTEANTYWYHDHKHRDCRLCRVARGIKRRAALAKLEAK